MDGAGRSTCQLITARLLAGDREGLGGDAGAGQTGEVLQAAGTTEHGLKLARREAIGDVLAQGPGKDQGRGLEVGGAHTSRGGLVRAAGERRH